MVTISLLNSQMFNFFYGFHVNFYQNSLKLKNKTLERRSCSKYINNIIVGVRNSIKENAS